MKRAAVVPIAPVLSKGKNSKNILSPRRNNRQLNKDVQASCFGIGVNCIEV